MQETKPETLMYCKNSVLLALTDINRMVCVSFPQCCKSYRNFLLLLMDSAKLQCFIGYLYDLDGRRI